MHDSDRVAVAGVELASPVELVAAAGLMRVLAAPIRIAIVLQLRPGPRCVHELAWALAAGAPLIEQHLWVLRGADVVRAHRQGRETLYQLLDHQVADLVAATLTHDQPMEAPRAGSSPHRPTRPA